HVRPDDTHLRRLGRSGQLHAPKRAFEERPVRALDLVAARQVQAEVRHVVGVFGEQPRVRGGVAVVPGLGETGEDIQDGVVGHDRTPCCEHCSLTNTIRTREQRSRQVRCSKIPEEVRVTVPPPPWRRTARKRAPKQVLSQDLIVRTALKILGKEGIDAVTMRRVAQELETGPASLYAHVTNKEELDELMLDAVLAGMPRPEPDPKRWTEQVKDLVRHQVQAMMAYPGIA